MSGHARTRGWTGRLRKTPHFITAAVLVAVAVPMSVAGPANAALQSFPSFFNVVKDQNGADDVQGQFDLSQLGRDDTDPTYLRMFWSWDDPSFSGGNTGDACALLDTNNNGMVDIAVCTVVMTTKGNPKKTVLNANPTVSSCDDAWTDRCGQPANLAYNFGSDIKAGAMNFAGGDPLASPPNDLVTETDPFHTVAPNDTDTTVEVYLLKTYLAGKNAQLVNVCSYPSSGFGASNNDPKDCVVNPGNGALKIVKISGSNNTATFPFTVTPAPAAGNPVNVQGNGDSGLIPMPVGNASIAENVPAGWLFNAGSCDNGSGTTNVAGAAITGITIAAGQTTTCTVTDVSDASIGLTKVPTPTQFSAVGQTIHYQLTATNTGNASLSNVTITDPGTNVTLGVCAPVQGSTLAPGATMVCDATHDITAGDMGLGSFTNTAHVAGTAPDGSSKTAQDTAVVTKIGPALSLTKSASPVTYTAVGQTITYTLKATNSGNVALTNVNIVDNDPNVTVNAASCTPALGSGLAVGATMTCTATYPIQPGDIGGSFTNTADASGTDPVNAPVNSNHATATVRYAHLSLTKTAASTTYDDAGVPVTYTLTATNDGNSTLNDVAITDSDAGVTLNPSPCSVGSLAVGATLVCHANYTTQPADVTAKSFTNTAHTTGTTLGGQSVGDSAQAVIKLAHLSLTKTASPTTFNSAGVNITYTLVATNDGAVPLTNVAIVDNDPGVALDSSKCNPVQPVANLAVGATITCTATYTTQNADVNAGKFTNTATVNGTDPNNKNVSADANATVNFVAPPPPPPPPPPPGNPALTLSKSSVPATGSTVQRGDSVTYTLSYANTGTAAATQAVASDPLPADETFVSASSGGTFDSVTRTVTWNVGSVAAGATGTVSFVAGVAATATDGETLTNVGVIGANGLGPVQSNPDTVTVSVPATPTPTLAVVKSVDKTTAEYGDTLTYTLTVTAGGADQTGVTVSDTIPDGVTYVDGSATCSTGCSGAAAGGAVSWNVGDMAQGATVTVSFQATINKPTPAADGGIPPETVTNFGTVNSDQVDPVDSNKVKTQVVAVLGITKNKPPVKKPQPEPSPLPFTGLPFPLLQTVVLSALMIVAGLWLTRPRRRRPLA